MDLADLDLLAPSDDHLSNHRGGEESMLDDPDLFGEPPRKLLRIIELGRVVGNDAAVGAPRHVSKLNAAESAQRRAQAELQQLQRNGRRQPLDELVGGNDDDEAISRPRDSLLPRVRCSAPLHEATRRATWSAPSI